MEKSCTGLDHVSSREGFRKVGDLLAKQYSFFYFFSFIHYSLLIGGVVAQLRSKYLIRELVCMLRRDRCQLEFYRANRLHFSIPYTVVR